jgi:hypothetical protein
MLQILQHWAAPHEIHPWLDLRARLSQAETKGELVGNPGLFLAPYVPRKECEWMWFKLDIISPTGSSAVPGCRYGRE